MFMRVFRITKAEFWEELTIIDNYSKEIKRQRTQVAKSKILAISAAAENKYISVCSI